MRLRSRLDDYFFCSVLTDAGVEGGQLAIVSGVLPLAYCLHHAPFYRRVVLLASVWLVERVFDLKLLGF